MDRDALINDYTAVVDVLDGLDVAEDWRHLRAVLEAPVDPTDEQSVDRAVAGAARAAWAAQLLYLRARRDAARVEEEADHDLGSLRKDALGHLMGEVEAKRINAQRVTNDLIDWTAREKSPDKWAALQDRKSRARAARDAIEGLHDKLMERSRRLGDLKGPSRAEVANRGASRR